MMTEILDDEQIYELKNLYPEKPGEKIINIFNNKIKINYEIKSSCPCCDSYGSHDSYSLEWASPPVENENVKIFKNAQDAHAFCLLNNKKYARIESVEQDDSDRLIEDYVIFSS